MKSTRSVEKHEPPIDELIEQTADLDRLNVSSLAVRGRHDDDADFPLCQALLKPHVLVGRHQQTKTLALGPIQHVPVGQSFPIVRERSRIAAGSIDQSRQASRHVLVEQDSPHAAVR